MNNRIYKFRAWDKRNKKMLSWENLMEAEGWDAFPKIYFALDETDKDFIPMQFTGLKDKNGKEIYEGDILEMDYGYKKYIVQVIWQNRHILNSLNGSYRIIGFGLKYPESQGLRDNISDFADDPDVSLEVIGNIHENKELLKVVINKKL
jgi:uncharacterized phage protein (TIGR01671 family)